MPPLHRQLLLATLIGILLSSTARADNPSTALLQRVAAKARATQTLRATLVLSRRKLGAPAKGASGSVLLMKPNLALIRFTGNDEAVPTLLASDGISLYSFPTSATYTKIPIDPHATQINEPWWSLPLRYFFTQSYAVFANIPDPSIVTALLPDETLHSQLFHVVSVKGTKPFTYIEKLYIRQDDLLQRAVVDFGSTTFTAELTDIQLNPPLTKAAFHFVPPAQATLQAAGPTDTMLAIGTTAPSFRLPSLTGASESLTAQSKGMKATLVNFWYLNCPPCRLENPEFEKLYQQFHAQGFNIVAIDKGDPPAAVTTYIRHAGLTYPILLGGEETPKSIFARYRVSTFPATYLLDANGHIVYRATGEDIAGLRQALKQLGFN